MHAVKMDTLLFFHKSSYKTLNFLLTNTVYFKFYEVQEIRMTDLLCLPLTPPLLCQKVLVGVISYVHSLMSNVRIYVQQFY